MKYIKKELIQAAFGLILGLAAQMVWADVINYQGYLTDKSGKPLNNETVNITLTFWDALTGGNAVGAPKSYPNVGVNNGVFSQNVDVSDITFTGPLFLELTVNGEKLAPRQFVTGVPFAYRAKTVEQDQDTLAGLNCAKDQIAKWNGSAWVCAATVATRLTATLTNCRWIRDRCETDGGYLIYFDRANNLRCSTNEVLTDWDVKNCGGRSYQLQFKCCSISIR